MKDWRASVLVIEDDENDLMFITRALKQCEVIAHLVAMRNGAEAVDYLSRSPSPSELLVRCDPVLILSDLKMPKMGGLEFLCWLREHPKYRVIPTVILTSSTDRQDVQRAFACGASGFMVKPVQFDQLQEVVKTIVQYWRLSLLPDASEGVA